MKHASFTGTTDSTDGGWFYLMKMREWAYAQVDVVDTATMPMSYVGGTNNSGVIRNITAKRSPDGKTITLKFYAHQPGNAYVHLRDSTGSDPWKAVDDKLMQLVVETRRAGQEADLSLTKLEGTTFVTNAPDTIAYELGTTEVFKSSDPGKLFDKVPAGANHVVVASHGKMKSGHLCMYVGGGDKDDRRLGNDNVSFVFAKLKGKVSDKCVVWLGGCGIGENAEFCNKAAQASGCPVIAAGHVLVNKKFKAGFVDILDRVSMPKLYLPTADGDGKFPPRSLNDFCMNQEERKFVVPV